MSMTEAAGHAKNEAFLSSIAQSDPTGVSRLYDKWSSSYETDLLGIDNNYTNPQKVAQAAADYIADKNCRVLDVCAGTGLVGEALKKLGFANVDAIDGSPAMLEKARVKGIYTNLYEEIIGTDGLKSVPAGSYDAVVTSGSFLPGHLGPRHLGTLAGAISRGGYFVMAMREEFLHSGDFSELEPEMKRMEEAGVWKRISWQMMDYYYKGLPGKIYVYQKL